MSHHRETTEPSTSLRLLADELRTHNLIAYAQLIGDHGNPRYQLTDLFDEISARLERSPYIHP